MSNLTERDLAEIEDRAREATPGPWFVRHLDDDYASNLLAVSTVSDPDHDDGPRWPGFSPGDIVAATLVQCPLPYVSIDDTKWDENAKFIAHARSDIPLLLAEIRRLRKELGDTAT